MLRIYEAVVLFDVKKQFLKKFLSIPEALK